MHLRLLLVLTLWVLSPALLAAEPVTSVAELDITRYAGQWYEIAHLPVSFQKRCVSNVTAAYTIREDGQYGVHNRCRTKGGDWIEARGVARRVADHPGRLKVRFVPDWLAWAPLVWADYWVIALDPDYQWAVVGDPDRHYLWILSRMPEMDRARFEQLKTQAEAMGYDLSSLVLVAPLR